ncbi:MAG: sulfatase-like hydrolase/transferase [Acidobacteria bacterium]|nr:sulfatase-like hydrolase/transferase [Acidobacteriota bacterium]
MNLSRRSLLAAAPFIQTKSRSAARPNVVFFLTDDHGAWANGCYGAKDIQTPNVDALARGGARFTQAFASTPVCSPSRMTYMTGCLPSTHGVQDWLIPEDAFGPKSRAWLDGHLTWSEVLAQAGYTLGMTGKWHMGHDDEAQRGFSYWATVPGGGGTYLDPEFVHNGVRKKTGKFKTDSVGDFALDFLSQQKKENPFCLFVPFYAPHTPYDPTPEAYDAPYQNCAFRDYPKLPPNKHVNGGMKRMFVDSSARGYSRLITGMDANVGRVVKRLEEMGLRENTLVIFSADQGWNAGHHGVWGKGNGTWPFNMLEESIRVPLIWNHPGRIRPSTPEPMVSSYDFFPTLLDYLGLKAPAEKKRVGQSYAGYVRGRAPKDWRTRLYFEYANVRSVRTKNLKYIERADGFENEMYDLEADPGETRNVIGEAGYGKQRAEFHEELTKYFEGIGAPPIEEWRKTVKQKMTVYKN